MKRPAVYSFLLHAAIFILLTVGFYNPFKRTLAEQKPMMIEFVNISEMSQAPVLAPQDVQEPDMDLAEQMIAEQEEPQPQPPVSQDSPPPPQPESSPPPEPEVKKPEPIAEPIPEPKPKVEEKKEEKKPEPTKEKPVEKKEEKKELVKEKIELNLEKKKPVPKVEKKEEKKKLDSLVNDILEEVIKDDKKAPATSKKKGGKLKGAPADQVGEILTGTEIDAIRRHITQLWTPPIGARGAKDLIVEIEVTLSKDRTVIDAKVVDKGRMARDTHFRAAAESAMRTVYDPRFSPLPLNPEKYDQWKSLILTFNPANM